MAQSKDKPKLGYVTIATVHRREEARVIAAKLAAASIDCSLVDERDTTQLAFGKLGLGEIKVQVNRQDATRALQRLHDQGGETNTSATADDSPQCVQRLHNYFTGWKLTVLEGAALIAVAGLLAMLLY
jgi:hypothetical protein